MSRTGQAGGPRIRFVLMPQRHWASSRARTGVMLFRGEFLTGSQLDLNKIVAHHPNDGELKFQRLQTKDNMDWIQEEANKVYDDKQGKRT